MAHYIDQARLDALVAKSHRVTECADHGDTFDPSSARSCRLTAPYQPGSIVKALVFNWVDDEDVRDVLIYKVEPTYSDRLFEWVDHYIGFVAKKDGTFGRMFRHIKRGEITRGYLGRDYEEGS